MVFSSLFLKSFSLKNRPLRVIGDVHGDKEGFSYATATSHFIIQLGDLVDYGPDTPAVLENMLELRHQDRGLFLAGNHERKLARALQGKNVIVDSFLQKTLDDLHSVKNRHIIPLFLDAMLTAPAWFQTGNNFFVHGGFHPSMLNEESPSVMGKVTPLLARALFGKVLRLIKDDGYPERTIEWVDDIPAGITVYCGHDQRSQNGQPWVIKGTQNGVAVFLDTGAGKGGHLSWIDLPAQDNL